MKCSFGIITKGERDNNIKLFIDSVRQQNIKEYEIIIVGKTNLNLEDDCKYIQFTEQDDKGWITRKKNIVCENAKYKNIFVGHDDIMLDKDWYKDMQEYGNDWQVLNFIYLNGDGQRNYWEYSSHRGIPYISGSFIALKNDVFKQFKWNEKLFWNQAEDVEFSQRLLNNNIRWQISNAKIKLLNQHLRTITNNEIEYFKKIIK
jgi:hypothetical protein